MHQIGFPVVSVSHEMGQIQLSQERFLLTGDLSPAESEAVWWVPVNPVLLGSGQELSSKSLRVEFDLKKEVEMVKLNASQAGFFRVAYAPDIFANLLQDLDTLTAGEKVCLIADTTALVRAGRTSVVELLQLLSSVRSETNYLLVDIVDPVHTRLTILACGYKFPRLLIPSTRISRTLSEMHFRCSQNGWYRI